MANGRALKLMTLQRLHFQMEAVNGIGTKSSKRVAGWIEKTDKLITSIGRQHLFKVMVNMIKVKLKDK